MIRVDSSWFRDALQTPTPRISAGEVEARFAELFEARALAKAAEKADVVRSGSSARRKGEVPKAPS